MRPELLLNTAGGPLAAPALLSLGRATLPSGLLAPGVSAREVRGEGWRLTRAYQALASCGQLAAQRRNGGLADDSEIR